MEIKDWSVINDDNNSPPPDGAPENTTKLGQINNIIRACMGVVARWSRDIDGVVASSGANNAYAIQLNRSIPALYDGLTFLWRVHAFNTGPSTLSVNGHAPRWIVDKQGLDLDPNVLNGAPLLTTYYAGLDKFVIEKTIEKQPPLGCNLMFIQPGMPVGWELVTTNIDRIPIFEGIGGGLTGGSWAISGMLGENVNHTHAFSAGGGTDGPSQTVFVESGNDTLVAGPGHSHSVGISGVTSGESASHAHAFDGNWRPPYVIVLQGIRRF